MVVKAEPLLVVMDVSQPSSLTSLAIAINNHPLKSFTVLISTFRQSIYIYLYHFRAYSSNVIEITSSSVNIRLNKTWIASYVMPLVPTLPLTILANDLF